MAAFRRRHLTLSLATLAFLLLSSVCTPTRQLSDRVERVMGGPGSSPPSCRSKCGRCVPCKAVHVPIQPGVIMPLEYYPEAWRCKIIFFRERQHFHYRLVFEHACYVMHTAKALSSNQPAARPSEPEMKLPGQSAPSSELQSPDFRTAESSNQHASDQPASTPGMKHFDPGAPTTDPELQLRGPVTRLRAKRLQQYLQGVLRRQFELVDLGHSTSSSSHPVNLLTSHAGDEIRVASEQ